ncbi:venom peptide SjAPI-like isoform X1 [Cydia pomonella]|uniref:venom peptide SjAPI-like isoform X1 n=1 Tax=Cydia pomonella TaxID=82600 RepID=UPI002ADD9582|nr:venom peptide SjAPI-like isoform X1 [Cydia pomonella]
MDGNTLFLVVAGLSFCGANPLDSGDNGETAIQCSDNEVFSSCTNGGCDARNCTQLGKPVPCVKLHADSCIKGCVCKPGFLRAANGNCVDETECQKERCTGPHEYFSCGGACDNVCATLQEQSQKNCPIRNIRCNDMCYCDEGHARDDNGVCVPTENC